MAYDIFKIITDRIIEEMEHGIIPWEKPWVSVGACVSHVTGRPYSLLNKLLLGRPGEYITYNQALEEGGNVRKGQKGHMVVFWKPLDKKDEQGNVVIDPDTGEIEKVFFLRYYTVFHIDQCDGIVPKHTPVLPDGVRALSQAEEMIARYVDREHITLRHEQGDRAYYQPSTDTVVLPTKEQFADTAEYYSTAFHELTHSTGHKSRLDRIADIAAFGSEEYSKEELIAQIGASALVHQVGLETKGSFRNNAAYIQNWLNVLKNDHKMLVNAAGKAEKAVNFILGGTLS